MCVLHAHEGAHVHVQALGNPVESLGGVRSVQGILWCLLEGRAS